jgi:hypothetical protein
MTKVTRCLFNGQQFCMCQGTVLLFSPIVSSPDYLAVAYNHSTHRHLATGSTFVSLCQCHTHVRGISKRIIRKPSYQDQWTIAQNNGQENSAAYESSGYGQLGQWNKT